MRGVEWGVGRVAAVAGAFAAVALANAPAQAKTIITATYTGTISLLLDKDALLGTEIDVQTPSNLAFTDTFVFDLDKGVRFTWPVGGIPADNLLGGSVFFGAAPLLSSRLTINGTTLDFLGTYTTEQYTQEGRLISSDASTFTPGDVWRYNTIAIRADAPALLTTGFSGPASVHDVFEGAAAICKLTASTCTDQRFSAWFSPQFVTVSVSVPEPASWALMILGFGGVGGVVRRRRAVAGSVA